MKKYGTILTSRPAGKEAAMTMKAYLHPNASEKIELDFEGVISAGPSWMDEVMRYLWETYGKERVVVLSTENPSVNESLKVIAEPS